MLNLTLILTHDPSGNGTRVRVIGPDFQVHYVSGDMTPLQLVRAFVERTAGMRWAGISPSLEVVIDTPKLGE